MVLSISRSIIEVRAGRLWAKSQTGKGATFYFTIPIAKTITGGKAEEA